MLVATYALPARTARDDASDRKALALARRVINPTSVGAVRRSALVACEIEVGQSRRVGDAELATRALGEPAGLYPHHVRGIGLTADLERGSWIGMSEQLTVALDR